MRVESDRRVEALRGAGSDAVQQLRAAAFTLVSGASYLFLTGSGDRDLARKPLLHRGLSQ